MTESVKVRQRVGQDGILHLEISVGLTDREIEVMVIYQAAPTGTTAGVFLEDLYDVCADDPIEIKE